MIDGYPHSAPLQTRWKDNDVYGHVNNVEFYSYFDTAINAWLISEGGLELIDLGRGDRRALRAQRWLHDRLPLEQRREIGQCPRRVEALRREQRRVTGSERGIAHARW